MNERHVESPAAATRQPNGAALALFAALTVVLTNPLVLHLAGAVEDKQDGLLNTWIIAWVGHALITDPLHLFDANIFFPYPNSLAFSEALLPQGLFALPFNLAFGNTILGYNLVLLASFMLAAYGMYLLVIELTHHRGAALVAGTIFAFSPYNLGNLAQVQLLSFGWLPLALIFLRRILESERDADRPGGAQHTRRDIVLFALFFSLQSLSSIYYAFLSGIAVVLFVAWALAARRSQFPALLRIVGRLAASGLLIALIVLPFLAPYFAVQRDMGFQRGILDAEPFSASLKLFAEVSPHNVVYGSLLAPRPPIVVGGYPLDNLFPGLLALGLAIAGLAAPGSRQKWFYALLLAVAFVLSLGPRLYVAPGMSTPVTLPYRWLYDLLPVAQALRAPVRFDALVMLALAVLAGLGVTSVESKLARKALSVGAKGARTRTSRGWLPLAACAIISVEYLAVPAASIAAVPTGNAIPAYVHWLAEQPHGTAIELPMMSGETGGLYDATAQYLTTYHWQRTPDGFSGFFPGPRGAIANETKSFPSERSVSLLQALAVRYIVFHSDKFADGAARLQAIGGYPDLNLAHQFGDAYVYEVAPRAQDAGALSAALFVPQPAAPDQTANAYLIIANRSDRSVASAPTTRLRIDVRWNDGSTQPTTVSLPLVTTRASVVPFPLAAPSRPGDYHLDVRASANGLPDWALSADVAVRDVEPVHQTVLPATVTATGIQSSYKAGDRVQLDARWLPYDKIDAYYSVSVRIVDAAGNKVAAEDREPAGQTMLWTPNVAVPDRFMLTIPAETKPGTYTVQVLAYQGNTGIDALLLNDALVPRETITLGTFVVR